ncbi:MAG: M23 family metallopeptidase [Neisseriaceae bacterium]
MSRSRDVTLLILDDGNTKEVKVRRGIVKNFNLIVLGTILFLVSLIVSLFFFIYNYSYTQFVAIENQRLLIKNYELSQKIVSLNNSIENELSNRIDRLDKANVLLDSIKKYLRDKGVSVDNKLTELATRPEDTWHIKTSLKGRLHREDDVYNDKQLSFLLGALMSVPLGFPHVGRITSPFGPRIHPITGRNTFHDGIDISGSYGSPIKATAGGEVIFAGVSNGYGNVVTVRHAYGYTTTYAHLSKIQVRNGQTIDAGEVVGNLGNTGRSTGPHLHYEIRLNNEPIEPMPYLSLKN